VSVTTPEGANAAARCGMPLRSDVMPQAAEGVRVNGPRR
jgi:hypothetical protein